MEAKDARRYERSVFLETIMPNADVLASLDKQQLPGILVGGVYPGVCSVSTWLSLEILRYLLDF